MCVLVLYYVRINIVGHMHSPKSGKIVLIEAFLYAVSAAQFRDVSLSPLNKVKVTRMQIQMALQFICSHLFIPSEYIYILST
jgi:hypothetical protein